MRGTGYGNVIAGNILALGGQLNDEKRMRKKWKMCWKCQKDKTPKGGYLRLMPGIQKFICKDCLDAKEKSMSELNSKTLKE